MKNFKRVLAVLMVLVLAFSMNALMLSVSAADTGVIVLNGDDKNHTSPMIKEYNYTKDAYKYLGFVTTKDATADYKYLQFTYTGDISTLRWEFEDVKNSKLPNTAKFWFNQDTEADDSNKHITVADGTTLTLKASSPTTIVVDLSKMGVSLGDYSGIHMHYSAVEGVTPEGFNITDARLLKSLSSNDPKPEPTKGTDNSSNPKTGVAPILPIALAAVACGGVLVVARKKK